MSYIRAMAHDVKIVVRIPSDLKDALAKAASERFLSESALVRSSIADWLRANGYLRTLITATGTGGSRPDQTGDGIDLSAVMSEEQK